MPSKYANEEVDGGLLVLRTDEQSISEASTQTNESLATDISDDEDKESTQTSVFPCDSVESISPQKERLRYLLPHISLSDQEEQSDCQSEPDEEINTHPCHRLHVF